MTSAEENRVALRQPIVPSARLQPQRHAEGIRKSGVDSRLLVARSKVGYESERARALVRQVCCHMRETHSVQSSRLRAAVPR